MKQQRSQGCVAAALAQLGTMANKGKVKPALTVATLWLFSGLGAGSAFLINVLLARELGPTTFGAFVSALTAVGLVAPLAGFGVAQVWLKVFGEEGWAGTRWFQPSVKFLLLSTGGALVLVFVWALFGPHDFYTRDLLVILSPIVVAYVALDVVTAKFQLEHRYYAMAIWQATSNLGRLLFIIVFVLLLDTDFTAWMAALCFGAVALFQLLYAASQIMQFSIRNFALHGHHNLPPQTTVNTNMLAVWKQAWPFGLATFFALIYFQSDVVIVAYLVGPEKAADYQVAFTVISAFLIFPNIIYHKYLMPKIHLWASHEPEKIFWVYRAGNRLMLVTGILSAIFSIAISHTVVPLIFGAKYISAPILTVILSAALPFIFLSTSVGSLLVIRNNMRLKVMWMGLVAGINIFLNFLLIPVFGAIGAAYSTILSYVVLLIVYTCHARVVYRELKLAS